MTINNKIKILFHLFVGFFLALMSHFGWAQTTPYSTFYMCVGAYCSHPIEGYQGPLTRYDSPGASAAELNQRHYEAYRYGKTQELQQYYQEIRQRQESQLRQMSEALQWDREAFMREVEVLRQHLEQALPAPSKDFPDFSTRRKLNRLPEGWSEARVERELDAVWSAAQESDPIELAEQVNKIFSIYAQIPRISEPPGRDREHRFILQEMRYSGLVSDQGLLKAPYANTPEERLRTSARSLPGVDIRQGVNKLLASQSVIGAACASEQSRGFDCEHSMQVLDELIDTYLVLDTLSRGDQQINPALLPVFNTLRRDVEFIFGVAKGVMNGMWDFVEGISYLVTHTSEVIQGLGEAIWNYRQTSQLILQGIHNNLHDFVNGGPQTRGEIVGRLAFEVATFLVPGGAIASRGMKVGSVVRHGMEEAVFIGLRAMSETIPLQYVAEASMYKAARTIGLRADEWADFARWGETYLNPIGKTSEALDFSLRTSPESYHRLRQVHNNLGSSVSFEAKRYLVNQVAYEQTLLGARQSFSPGDLSYIARTYDEIATGLTSVAPTRGPPGGVEAVRAAMKQGVDSRTGLTYVTYEGSLFRAHAGMVPGNGRYSRPGQEALYVAVGPNARQTAILEMTKGDLLVDSSLYIVGQKTFYPQKILDLTDPQIGSLLKLSETVNMPIGRKYEYLVHHMIGEAAARRGYDAIRFESQYGSGINMVLYGGF